MMDTRLAGGLRRREWHRLLVAGLLAGAAGRASGARGGRAEPLAESRSRGVLIGVQSYSFGGRDLRGVVDGMRAAGVTSCELWQGARRAG